MPTNITDPKEFLKMSGEQLDEIFRNSPVGEIPRGQGEGTAIVKPGTKLTRILAWLVKHCGWQGKVFDPEKGQLINLTGISGRKRIIAKVYKDKSWFDGKDCIALDYSKTSLIAGWIRDEIREVSPGIYLGLVYGSKKKLIHFALKFSPPA